jgi:tetratricopeptide (TPR) repeat protein
LELGDERQALDDAAKAIQLDPQSSMFCSRAFMRVRLGDFRAALDDMNKAVELAPDDAFYCEVRGSVHNRLGKHDAAIADCDRALELDPKLAVAYLVRAVAKMAKGEYESANADFRSANELDPESFPLTQVPHKPSPIAADGTFERAASEYNTNAEESRSAGDFSPFYFQRLVYGQPPKEPLAPYGAEMGVDPDLAKRNIIAELCKIAWRAATSPDERYRDGIRASEKAIEACKLTEFKDPRCVEALAAACAECGDFATAVRYQTLAIELHDNREQFRLARQPNKTPSSLLDLDGPDREQRRERLRLYRNRRAYRDAR